ncbi:MAG: InlB B-repeat-containing protein [Bacilli bacterium]
MTKSNTISKLLLILLAFVLTFGLVGCFESADEKAAKAVDEAILALPETVAITDNDVIVAARTAYDALTEDQKGLVENLTALETKETALAALKDAASALAVDNLIAALPAVVTLLAEDDVIAARTAYDALTATQKALVTKLADLIAKEESIASLNADKNAATLVINKIEALPDVIALTSEAAINFARASYDLLTTVQKALVTNLAALETAEATLASLKEVAAVEALITALPATIALTDEEQVLAARAAYDALTSDQKATVLDYATLTAAEAAIVQIKATIADQEAAAAVDLLIVSLPATIEITDKDAIVAARTAYDALTETRKALVTALSILVAKEERLANLEAAAVVVTLITDIPDTLVLADESKITAARTAYDALTEAQKDMVTNYDRLLEKEEDMAIVKNPDLAVLLPVIKEVPSQIIVDFVLPTTNGVVWSYKTGEDTSFFDLETGELLQTTYAYEPTVLVATYNTTSKEVVVNFGLVEEGQKAIFYSGQTKPEAGNTWDGFGTYETQMEAAGFGGYKIVVGTNVYFISKDAYIPISGTTANEVISRTTLRPYGLDAQTDYNNIGLKNGVAVAYSGAAALYQNTGSVAVTFDASDTYGRCNVPNLGFGKIMFTKNADGTYTVAKYLADHGGELGGNSIGSTGVLMVTLNPGDFLWTPHSWEVDYSNIGYGTRLCQMNNGVLVEGTIIAISSYKLPDLVKKMISDINALPNPVTLTDEEQVIAIRTAYDGFTAEEQALITNYALLQAAEAEIVGLKAAAQLVADISALPAVTEITLDNETAIANLLQSYANLLPAHQLLVTNIATLEAAEVKILELKGMYQIIYVLDGGAFVGDYPTIYDITKLPQPLVDPIKEGYDFMGWFAASDFSGSPIMAVPLESTGAKTYYAKWQLTPISVAEVLTVMDTNPGQKVAFEGIIIGTTLDNFFFVADETGAVYVRFAVGTFQVGDNVRVDGTANVYLESNKQYTRQVSSVTSVIKLDELVYDNPLATTTAQIADLQPVGTTEVLTAEEIAAVKANTLYGKYISVTGYVTIQGTFSNVYLATTLEVGAPKLYVYYQSRGQDELKFLVGKQVTLFGTIYNYDGNDKWALTYLGDLDITLTDLEKEAMMQEEIEGVISEGQEVMGNLAFFTASKYQNTFPGVTVAFTSNNTAVISDNGTFTKPATNTPVVITVTVTFSPTHSKVYTYNVTASSLTQLYAQNFETGFTPSSTYNNTTPKSDGPEGYKWSFYYGTIATTSAISGSNSIQNRWYTSAPANLGYAVTEFTVANLTRVVFKAAATYGLNVTVSYSTDGTTYVGEETFTLDTLADTYIYNLPSAQTAYVKFQITLPETNPTSTSNIRIDDVTFYG